MSLLSQESVTGHSQCSWACVWIHPEAGEPSAVVASGKQQPGSGDSSGVSFHLTLHLTKDCPPCIMDCTASLAKVCEAFPGFLLLLVVLFSWLVSVLLKQKGKFTEGSSKVPQS